MTDVYLKIKDAPRAVLDGRKRRISKRLARAIRDNGLDRLLGRDLAGKEVVETATHDVAVNFIQDYIVTEATYDADGNEITPPVFGGPLLMIRFHSASARDAWAANKDKIGPNLEKIPQPATIGGWL